MKIRPIPCIATLATFLVVLLAAAPAWSGTVYVPLAVQIDVDTGVEISTHVRVTNGSDERRSLSYVFLPAGVDGTGVDRAAERIELSLAPRESRLLKEIVPQSTLGILEITADPGIAVSSRLAGTTVGGWLRPGTEMPVLDASRFAAGGTSILLQGGRRDETRQRTDLFLFQPGGTETACDLVAFRPGGREIGRMTVAVPPLALWGVNDILAELGETTRFEASFLVTCDADFHAFSVLTDVQTGEVVYIAPARLADGSILDSPGGGPPGGDPPGGGPPAPSFTCPDGTIFKKEGAFHRPVRRRETRRFEIPMASGRQLSKLTLQVDFTPGPWNQPASGNHAVVWLNRTERWGGNVFAYVNVFGPSKNIANMSTNADRRDGAPMHAFNRQATFQEGVPYRLRYVYDTAARTMRATFIARPDTPNESEVVTISGSTTTNVIRSEAPGFFVYFGHPTGTVGPEVPTYDWLYSNLCVWLE